MTILILDKVSLAIQSSYQADAPNQSAYGGPWGDPHATVHIALEEGLDKDCIDILMVDGGEIHITADAEKVAAKAIATQQAIAAAQLDAAIGLGNKLIRQFTLENMALGITQAGKTGEVRKAMAEVISALSTGSLYDAMDEMRAVPAESKDATFITDARLLAAIHQIEAFLGMQPSASL